MTNFADLNSDFLIRHKGFEIKINFSFWGGLSCHSRRNKDLLSCMNCDSILEIKGHWSQSQDSVFCCLCFATNWHVTQSEWLFLSGLHLWNAGWWLRLLIPLQFFFFKGQPKINVRSTFFIYTLKKNLFLYNNPNANLLPQRGPTQFVDFAPINLRLGFHCRWKSWLSKLWLLRFLGVYISSETCIQAVSVSLCYQWIYRCIYLFCAKFVSVI